MGLTLLFDLDDTLLDNDIDLFLPAYLQALAKYTDAYIKPDTFISNMLSATKRMTLNRRPDCTLQQVFDAAFFPAVGIERVELEPVFERFYEEVFPTFKSLTKPRPGVVKVVKEAFERGYRLAVATNPLFPLTANLQRLAWAGLPVEKYPFELVTSYETFHFAKPQPAFFAEVLGRLGWPDGPIVMIGDDLKRDIAATRQLGLPAFWIKRDGAPIPQGDLAPTASGGLEDLLPWLDAIPAEVLTPDTRLPSAMLAVLLSTPAVLNTIGKDLTTAQWTERPAPGEWCLAEIACHLRDVEQEVNLPRLKQVLQEDNPFLPGKDTDPWAEERLYICQDGAVALHHFTMARMALVDLLTSIQPEAWQRPARHSILSRTTLSELVSIIASHDRLHIQQALKI